MSADRQTEHILDTVVKLPVRLRYLLYLPEGYGDDPAKRWPLVLFLHGMGERGDDLELVKKHGIPKMVKEGESFPFVVISPQCPADSWWTGELPALQALLDHALQEYAVDPDRVYLTGLSMGGYGTWHLASAAPHRFAAVAPVCGGGLSFFGFPEKVTALREVPVWAFHGEKDEVVPLAESEKLVQQLQAVGGDARLTVYPECGHNSWDAAYSDPELYRWFLSHRRRGGEASPGQ
ncbi:MAG: prolyl oligopeptidase family serine peptidase [Anaerolineae bacterium]|jgi:predicted peptidase